MRTNIDIDDALMAQALQAGPFKTKKDAVEAGLKLLARQAAYREVAKWRGKLKWEGDEGIDWVAANHKHQSSREQEPLRIQEPRPAYAQTEATAALSSKPATQTASRSAAKPTPTQKATRARR